MPELNEFTDLSELSREVTSRARDALYVAVGLGVLGFQRAQVQRVELQNKLRDLNLETALDDVRTQLNRQVKTIDDLVEDAFRFIETSLEPVEEQLPPGARELAKKVHLQAREVRSQIRERVVPVA
jgi:uncharacterized protein HemX